jgi:hypothetical protein
MPVLECVLLLLKGVETTHAQSNRRLLVSSFLPVRSQFPFNVRVIPMMTIQNRVDLLGRMLYHDNWRYTLAIGDFFFVPFNTFTINPRICNNFL